MGVHFPRVGGIKKGGKEASTIGMGVTVINRRIGKKLGVAGREEGGGYDWEGFCRVTDI